MKNGSTIRTASGIATKCRSFAIFQLSGVGSGGVRPKPPSAYFGIDEVDQLAPELLGFAADASGARGTFAASARRSALSSLICRTVRPTQLM